MSTPTIVLDLERNAIGNAETEVTESSSENGTANQPSSGPIPTPMVGKTPLTEKDIAQLGNQRLTPLSPTGSPELVIIQDADTSEENKLQQSRISTLAEDIKTPISQKHIIKQQQENLFPSFPKPLDANANSIIVDIEAHTAALHSGELPSEHEALSGDSKTSVLDPSSDILDRLKSIYAHESPAADLERNCLSHYFEDSFNGRYSKAFDVFYNTRQFFNQPSGTIFDDLWNTFTISAGTTTGKSIYGVYVNDSALRNPGFGSNQSLSAPPNTPSKHRRQPTIVRAATTPTRRFNSLQLHSGLGGLYGSSFASRHSPKRTISVPATHRRSVLMISPPRSPQGSNNKRSSSLRPKAVMAWWKERDAAVSHAGNPHQSNNTKYPTCESLKKSISSLSTEDVKKKSKGKRRNPLRRLSALFTQRANSSSNLKSISLMDEYSKSLHSLPSQVFLPECKDGTPSFITTNIVKNYRRTEKIRSYMGIDAREGPVPSSFVQQRVYSFEAPRPTLIEKKYQTSPSYQMLHTIKPVRGRSLREGIRMAKEPDCVQMNAMQNTEHKADLPEGALIYGTLRASQGSLLHSQISSRSLSPKTVVQDISLVEECSVPSALASNSSEGETSGFNSLFKDIYDAKIAMSTPALSTNLSHSPIITSTPLRRSPQSLIKTPSRVSLVECIETPPFRRDSSLLESQESIPPLENLNMHIVEEPLTTILPTKRLEERNSGKLTHSLYPLSSGIPIDYGDDKENIEPIESIHESPNVLPSSTNRVPALSQHSFARFEADISGFVLETRNYIRQKNKNLRKRSISFLKSAVGSLRSNKSGNANRPSISNAGSYKQDKVIQTSIPEGDERTSFRVLQTLDSFRDEKIETQEIKRRSILSVRLARKKKPILVVPKHPKKVHSRRSLFNLFSFKRARQEPSFVIHRDTTLPSTRKSSGKSGVSIASMISKGLGTNMMPFSRGGNSVFQAEHPAHGDAEEELREPLFERSISPPPRLELHFSRSSF